VSTTPDALFPPVAARRADYSFGLPALGVCVAEARRRVRGRLLEWGVEAGVREDAALVVSELVGNAVRHTVSERIACALGLGPRPAVLPGGTPGGRVLRLEVSDSGGGVTVPAQRRAGFDEEGGRGLLLVGALCSAWGVLPGADGRGRLVWAELTCVGD
jgi:anti-sigma regulatory factor (Ser/Thr protein kinase)